jgi:hypothetical protein
MRGFGKESISAQNRGSPSPAREPLEVLEQLRQTQGEHNFAGQYQQSPAPLGRRIG